MHFKLRRFTRLSASFLVLPFVLLAVVVWVSLPAVAAPPSGDAPDLVTFHRDIAPLLQQHCLRCHHSNERHGGLSFSNSAEFLKGGDSGPVVVPGEPNKSLLLHAISPDSKGKAAMPDGGLPLPADAIEQFRNWISAGANWPADHNLTLETWWSFKPLNQVALPSTQLAEQSTLGPIDQFLLARLKQKGLDFSPEADRRTLIRRLSFDLTGLPPTFAETEAFIADEHPQAYEHLVDKLLASPHYGERQAQHWLDVVHYGETHGYDKDKMRPNAWPYRDYVIRAFNEDKPYGQFVREQIAGDVLAPNSVDGIEALGFIAAGPWDYIGHAEVSEEKIDGKVARHLDRDDMVRNTFETFCSLTVGCAQCHDHKFDPIQQVDYYRVQSLFAALDRADRPYDRNPQTREQRQHLLARQAAANAELAQNVTEINRLGGDALKQIESQIAAAEKSQGTRPPEHGYHSAIANSNDVVKWAQVELPAPTSLQRIVLNPCFDDFNGIGEGFGFPVRYHLEGATNQEFTEGVTLLVDRTLADQPNPGIDPVTILVKADGIRYVRITATKLATRKDDYILALSEMQIFNDDGTNVAVGRPVTALDSIEAPGRWRKANLVDNIYPQSAVTREQLDELTQSRETLLSKVVPAETLTALHRTQQELADIQRDLEKLPPVQRVYAGTVHTGAGTFRGTGANGGKPRKVMLLDRGDVTRPTVEVTPAALNCLPISGDLSLPESHTEGDRRAALANWLSHRENPLVWRSIVNRIWQSHFGTGIVDTPNDFGRMGGEPSHPELLDWLAVDFRDSGESLKRLHRQIVVSRAYRQQSAHNNPLATEFDPDNRLLWRQQRRRLDAEEVRDAMLMTSGLLNLDMGGPSFQDFVVEKPEHSPHYEYARHDPLDPKSHRRSVYRMIVRSQTQPFLTVLDCADPSMQVPRRNETISPLQALSLLNNRLSLALAGQLAERVRRIAPDTSGQVAAAFRLALSRTPTRQEQEILDQYLAAHNLENLCRLLWNANEFVFVD
ncbi:MAG: PSD1 and planctomycete cytochrome C domain-containing protein [Planctomycetaceae bacterium]